MIISDIAGNGLLLATMQPAYKPKHPVGAALIKAHNGILLEFAQLVV